MTFQEAYLLRLLKRAQINQDRDVYIDYDKLTLITVGDATQERKEVKIKRFKNSIHSIIKSLADSKYIDISRDHIHVKHRGWCAFQLTVQEALRFTFRDIVVPLLVSWSATWLPAIVRILKFLIESAGA